MYLYISSADIVSPAAEGMFPSTAHYQRYAKPEPGMGRHQMKLNWWEMVYRIVAHVRVSGRRIHRWNIAQSIYQFIQATSDVLVVWSVGSETCTNSPLCSTIGTMESQDLSAQRSSMAIDLGRMKELINKSIPTGYPRVMVRFAERRGLTRVFYAPEISNL